MKLQFSETNYNVDTKELSVVVTAAASIEEFSEKSQYGRDSFREQVVSKVANAIAEKFVAEHSDEIVKGVDIDQIIKRVQLYTVQHMTAQQR